MTFPADPVYAARRAHLQRGLSREALGLEIGPSYQPVAPKADGWRVEVLDYLNEQGLREKLAREGHDVSLVENVDHVWAGQRLPDLVGPARFDWVIASHVVEHVPDLIAFLQDCEAVLKPGGVLAIALPDRRHCFDAMRPSSGLARVIDAHVERRKQPSPGAVAEHVLYAVLGDGQTMWTAPPGKLAFAHDDAQHAVEVVRQVVEDAAYHDVHVWAFTPSRFRIVLHDLWRMQYFGLREERVVSDGAEFFAHFSLNGTGPTEERLALARMAADEEGGVTPRKSWLPWRA